MPNMDPDKLQAVIAAALNTVFEERARMPEEAHREHHAWVAARIAKERAREEFWQSMAAKSLPMLVVALLGSLGTAIVHAVKWAADHLRWS